MEAPLSMFPLSFEDAWQRLPGLMGTERFNYFNYRGTDYFLLIGSRYTVPGFN
jgi:hypothetical protein